MNKTCLLIPDKLESLNSFCGAEYLVTLHLGGLGLKVWRGCEGLEGRQLSNFLDFFVTFFVKEISKLELI